MKSMTYDVSQEQTVPYPAFTVPSGETMVQTIGLTKVYGKRTAVGGLNLEIKRGEVFGFLGPNGAGKTTTIRMLLNLIKPTAGEVRLFGERLSPRSRRLLSRVGALIEYPAFPSYLSGRDNLLVVGGYTGGVSSERVQEVLELVGLGTRGDDRTSTYSLGMRQRLGVGAALLTDPDLIILDEPGNGLDPAGIVEMRELIRKLASLGKTLLVSSHILAEVRQFCTRIGIVRAGRLIASGTVEELLQANGPWELRVASPERVGPLLSQLPLVRSAKLERKSLLLDAPTLRGEDLLRYLVQMNIWPESLHRREEELEEVFLRLTDQEAGL